MGANSAAKIELLAPAGNLEKLAIAVHYGADAVYLAGKEFSLRNFSGNFSVSELEEAVELARSHGVKVYLACNIYSRTHEAQAIRDLLEQAGQIGPDAVLVSDPKPATLMQNRRVAFLNTELGLIELLEKERNA